MRNVVKNFDAEPFSLTKVFDSVKSLHLTKSAKEKLVVILGATSTGKSSLALRLAEEFDTEIISADSMAVYKNFNVGTAKPTQAELEQVPHHLINILDAEEKFSVGEFVRRARPIITDLNIRGKIPIVAGGTGLYIQALVEGYFLGTSSKSLVPSSQFLVPTSSHYKQTGELIYEAMIFGLTSDRPELYDRINRRTAEMFSNGLVDEVKNLLASGISPTAQAMLGIGYKETVEYLQGNSTLEETISNVAQATRNFAKRQLTWYRRMKYITWLKI
ncbi:MAG: tRNA dimethylallyltransferase [Selenomonadaceae bacterium]|nr:tRNA dimethylallyltransferase [Selenomonadaceae bacterium]